LSKLKRTDLTQEIVKELLDYDPKTGKLVWKNRDVKWFKDTKNRTKEWVCKWWNNRFANKEAFTSKDSNGYLCGGILSVRVEAHRIIWLW